MKVNILMRTASGIIRSLQRKLCRDRWVVSKDEEKEISTAKFECTCILQASLKRTIITESFCRIATFGNNILLIPNKRSSLSTFLNLRLKIFLRALQKQLNPSTVRTQKLYEGAFSGHYVQILQIKYRFSSDQEVKMEEWKTKFFRYKDEHHHGWHSKSF